MMPKVRVNVQHGGSKSNRSRLRTDLIALDEEFTILKDFMQRNNIDHPDNWAGTADKEESAEEEENKNMAPDGESNVR